MATKRDFIVETREVVAGKYLVSARDPIHAKQRVEDIMTNDRNWNGIEQLEYMAFDVEAIEAYSA